MHQRDLGKQGAPGKASLNWDSWTGNARPNEPRSNPHPSAASIGMICIAVLVQRASDKSPAVRSKALSHLAGVISSALENSAESLLTNLRHVSLQTNRSLSNTVVFSVPRENVAGGDDISIKGHVGQ